MLTSRSVGRSIGHHLFNYVCNVNFISNLFNPSSPIVILGTHIICIFWFMFPFLPFTQLYHNTTYSVRVHRLPDNGLYVSAKLTGYGTQKRVSYEVQPIRDKDKGIREV
jgi:hypothetical protein